MGGIVDILESLESASGRLKKESILKNNSDNKLLKQILILSFDTYTQFGVKKFTSPEPNENPSNDNSLGIFCFETLPSLANKILTGNAARSVIIKNLSFMDSHGQKWAKRILNRNLRIGVRAKTVNKVWPDTIVEFKVQLAETLKTQIVDESIVTNISYPVRVEPKIDGLRMVAFKRKGIVTMFTRNGKPITTLPTIRLALETCRFDNFVLDGESMGKDWNESASILGSKVNEKNDENIVFNVFDAMPAKSWFEQSSCLTLTSRLSYLHSLVQAIASDNIRPISGLSINNDNELSHEYSKCLSQGFEGVMIKIENGKYEFKRTKNVQKLKPVATYEGTIVGMYEGREGTILEGNFGGFKILLSNGAVTSVGSGFSHELRTKIFNSFESSYLGEVIEVEGQAPLTGDGKIRFPVFTGKHRNIADIDPKITEAYEKYKETV